jgi:hypothetical protein
MKNLILIFNPRSRYGLTMTESNDKTQNPPAVEAREDLLHVLESLSGLAKFQAKGHSHGPVISDEQTVQSKKL